MKIVSVSGQEIPAAAQFKVNGFEVSCSSVFKPSSIAIFDAGGDDVTGYAFQESSPMATPENIVKAFAFCNAQ